MKQVKLFVLSDIHFEKFHSTKQKQFVLDFLNKKITQTQTEGFEPIIILAGDIDNQDKSYLWMSKVNAPIIYIAGNHEFWDGDYYDTINLLQNNAPANVTFLHNDICEVGQYLFIGSTLWTDIGESLNPDIFVHASTRMNDMTSITAKKWYDNPSNIEKLYSVFPTQDADKMTHNKFWNGLVEREENEEAWNFLSMASDVLEALLFSQKISNENFLNNDFIDSMSATTEFSNPSLSFHDFLVQLTKIDAKFALSEDDFMRLSKHNGIKKERIFQKMRQFTDIHEKEVIILSHHLPFYEEAYIGQHRLKGESSKSLLNQIHHQNFFVREGTHYPEENILEKATNGDIIRKNDVTHIVNYFNNGTRKLSPFLNSKVDIWIHGHEHLFNYSDFIKGIQLISNTAGIIFQRLTLADDLTPTLSKTYMQYHGIKVSQSHSVIENFRQSLVRSPIKTPSEADKFAMVHMWAMKNFKWQDYSRNLDRMINACANIINSAVEFSALEISNVSLEEKSEKIHDLEEQTNQFIDIFNQNLLKHQELLNHYALAIRIRLDRDFSISEYFNSIYIDNSKYYTHLLGSVPELNKISDFIGMFSGNMAFKNLEYLLIIKKQMDNLYSFIQGIDILEPTLALQEHIDEFKSLSSIRNDKEEIRMTQEIVDRKWLQFLNNLTTSQQSPQSPDLEDETFLDIETD